jgi:hypothetical protein
MMQVPALAPDTAIPFSLGEFSIHKGRAARQQQQLLVYQQLELALTWWQMTMGAMKWR